MNRNNICQITIFANRNNIYEIKLWRIGIGNYLWPEYQRIDSSRTNLQTIRKLFTNRDLFAEHWTLQQLAAPHFALKKICKKKALNMWHVKPDTGHLTPNKWHVKRGMWHLTPDKDMWHMTCDNIVGGEHSPNISAL